MAGAVRIPCVVATLLALLALAPAAANATAARGERVEKPRIEFDPIPHDSARKRQMAAYSDRHYGDREWRLENPRAIVLHYTAGSPYSSAWSTFASNAPSLGERPGVCAQFIVDKDGTIYQLTRLAVRCRHTIGLNHVAFGIEMVHFSVGWRDGEPPGSGYYQGPHPFSESESRALRRLIGRIEPDLTIHYHQPWGAVLAPCRGPIPAQRLYSRISRLRLDRCRGQDLPGTVTRWQNRRGGTAFVVELPERGLSEAGRRRHARAAARVAAGS